MFKKINFYQILITIFAVILASAAIVYGWTAPTGAPPGNDVEAPINTGETGQVKKGGLSVALMPTNSNIGFRVITGNLVIGSSSPAVSKSGIFDEFISARDVWIRDANNGAGAWASALGGGNMNNLRMGPKGCNFEITPSFYCYTLGCERCTGGGCASQYYTCDGQCGGNDPYICRTQPLSEVSMPFCFDGSLVGQTTYSAWSDCIVNVPNACGSGMDCTNKTTGTFTGTQTRTATTCQADGNLTTVTETRSCSKTVQYCASIYYRCFDSETGRWYDYCGNCYDPNCCGG